MHSGTLLVQAAALHARRTSGRQTAKNSSLKAVAQVA